MRTTAETAEELAILCFSEMPERQSTLINAWWQGMSCC